MSIDRWMDKETTSLSLFPGDLTNPGIKPRSLALQADSLPFELTTFDQFVWPIYRNMLKFVITTIHSLIHFYLTNMFSTVMGYLCSPPNSSVEGLTLQCRGVRMKGIWGVITFRWGPESRSPMIGRRDTRALSIIWRYSQKTVFWKPRTVSQEESYYAGTLMPHFPASRIMKKIKMLGSPM